MRGPIGPIVKKMAGWYAARFLVEFEDLVQEARLALERRPQAPQVLVAQTAMRNWIDRHATLRKWDLMRCRPEAMIDPGPSLVDLDDLLEQLPPAERSVLVEQVIENWSLAETAARHDRSVSWVTQTLRKAKDHLKEILS